MTHFRWHKIYSVNSDVLDEHHKKLFDIYNKLEDHCVNSNDKIIAEQIIEELINYSSYHFYAEEQYMEKLKYKDINKHISEHKEFTFKAIHLQQAIINDEKNTIIELKKFLGKWLKNHVIEEDKRFTVK